MKVLDLPQGSDEWFAARCGIPTASEFSALVTPAWKLRNGEMPRTYLAKKLAERWMGRPLASGGGWATEQGSLLEMEAVPWLEFERGIEVARPGFILSDDGRIGCSPDGLLPDGAGLEVKCPQPHTHARYLLDGTLPAEYRPQVQGGMLVTGADRWMFLSYCRHMPPLLLTVERDGKAQDALGMALAAFNIDIDAAYERLVEINGGPPKRPEAPSSKALDQLAVEPPRGPTAEEEAEWLAEANRNLDDLRL